MKKFMMAATLLIMAITANAQVEFKGDYKQGQSATYEVTLVNEMANPQTGMPINLTVNYTNKYVINEAASDGYVIESTFTKADIQGEEDMTNDVKYAIYSMLQGQPVLVQTDTNGKFQSIKNWDTVKAVLAKANEAGIDKIIAAHPEITQQMTKEQLLQMTDAQITEALVMEAVDCGAFDLNGKTIKSGDEVTTVEDGINMKSNYTVTPMLGTTIVVEKSTANMTEEETKAFVFEKLKESGAPEEQIQMMEANWGQLVAMGVANVDFNETNTFRMKNGWAQSIDSVSTQSLLGMNIKITRNAKLVE